MLVSCSTSPKSNLISNSLFDTVECSHLEYLAKQEKKTIHDVLAVSEYRSTAVFIQERLVARKLQNQLDKCVHSYADSMMTAINYRDEKVRSHAMPSGTTNEVKNQVDLLNQANARLKDCALIQKSSRKNVLKDNDKLTESQLAICNSEWKELERKLGNRFKMLFIGGIESSLDSFRKSWSDEIKNIAASVGSRIRLRETSQCQVHAEAVSNHILSETDDELHDVIDSPLFIGYRNCLK